MALLLNFVETFDEKGGEVLEIGIETLLLFQVSIFGAVTLEDQIEKWIIIAIHLQFNLSRIAFVSLNQGTAYKSEKPDFDNLCAPNVLDIAIIVHISDVHRDAVVIEGTIASICFIFLLLRLGSYTLLSCLSCDYRLSNIVLLTI